MVWCPNSGLGHELAALVFTAGTWDLPAATAGFTHTQSSPAATWTITNTLGRYPSAVSIFVGGVLVEADVETPDTSTISITFASAQSGRAEII